MPHEIKWPTPNPDLITDGGRCRKCGVPWIRLNTMQDGGCLHCFYLQTSLDPKIDWFADITPPSV